MQKLPVLLLVGLGLAILAAFQTPRPAITKTIEFAMPPPEARQQAVVKTIPAANTIAAQPTRVACNCERNEACDVYPIDDQHVTLHVHPSGELYETIMWVAPPPPFYGSSYNLLMFPRTAPPPLPWNIRLVLGEVGPPP